MVFLDYSMEVVDVERDEVKTNNSNDKEVPAKQHVTDQGSPHSEDLQRVPHSEPANFFRSKRTNRHQDETRWDERYMGDDWWGGGAFSGAMVN